MKTLFTFLALFAVTAAAADVTESFPPGTALAFAATADGDPAPTFQWKKDNIAIAGATNQQYLIASVFPSHAGRYTVTATNVAGSATSVDGYVLRVFTPPSMPTIKVTAKKPGDVVLSVPAGVKVVYQSK